ncbi:MAG: hypothetical protein HKM95_17730 [Inquilinus sp.]|nr:hypothetical protein [Inquilinus sp.]
MSMFPKARRWVGFMLVAGIAAAMAPSSFAHRMHPAEVVGTASHQRILVRVMLKDLMLLSLQVEPQRTLSSLRNGRSAFDKLIEEVGEANAEMLEQSETVPGDLVERYDETVAMWRQFDESILDALATRRVSAGQVAHLLELGGQLGESIDRLYFGYREAANHYGVTSVLGRAIEVGERTQAASQRVFAEYFALANSGAEAGDPRDLLDLAAEVDRRIAGLIEGDPESGLLPAPTREIRSHLVATQLLWEEARPVLDAAVAGETASNPDIETMVRIGGRLLDDLAEAGIMLAGLMPEAQRPRPRRFDDAAAARLDDAGA